MFSQSPASLETSSPAECEIFSADEAKGKNLDEKVEFVETLPDELLCQICYNVLREPHVTDCCGQHLCKGCLDSSVTEYTNIKKCPYCREKHFNHLIYKPYQRKINELKIYCKHKSEGCTEILEYKGLKHHLAITNTSGCLYTSLDCPNGCCARILRKDLEEHCKDCPNRQVTCEHCDGEMMYHELDEHYEECDKYPVLCPRSCSDGMFIREQLTEHEKKCPNTIVECPFQEAGCTDEVTRAQLTAHLESNMADHLGKLMIAYCQLKSEFQSLKNDLEEMKISGKKISKSSASASKADASSVSAIGYSGATELSSSNYSSTSPSSSSNYSSTSPSSTSYYSSTSPSSTSYYSSTSQNRKKRY